MFAKFRLAAGKRFLLPLHLVQPNAGAIQFFFQLLRRRRFDVIVERLRRRVEIKSTCGFTRDRPRERDIICPEQIVQREQVAIAGVIRQFIEYRLRFRFAIAVTDDEVAVPAQCPDIATVAEPYFQMGVAMRFLLPKQLMQQLRSRAFARGVRTSDHVDPATERRQRKTFRNPGSTPDLDRFDDEWIRHDAALFCASSVLNNCQASCSMVTANASSSGIGTSLIPRNACCRAIDSARLRASVTITGRSRPGCSERISLAMDAGASIPEATLCRSTAVVVASMNFSIATVAPP